MAVILVFGLAFVASVTIDAGAIVQSNLQERVWGVELPIVAFAALLGVIAGARARRDEVPLFLTVLFFFTSYLTLGVMFGPYMVPYSITVANAAAPDTSLGFLFYGGVIVLSVIAIYSVGVYYIFAARLPSPVWRVAEGV